MDDSKKLHVMANIMRAAHFEWRRAALALTPGLDPVALVKQYWEEVGKDTAAFYVSKIDPAGDVAQQVAKLFVGSSIAMAEDATYAGQDGRGCHIARHDDCPWYHWHKKQGLLAEDQVGCDHWLKTVVDGVNDALGTKVRYETVETIPGGAKHCTRHFWAET